MKRTAVLLFFIVLTLGNVRAAERILSFDSRIEVQTNGGLLVTETIRAEVTGLNIQHGIYRDFPQLYATHLGLRSRNAFVVREVRRDGRAEDHHLAERENGTRVYLGSPSITITPGIHVWQLTYFTDRQLGFFRNHDELYWNVTGNGWVFPIETVTATVALPNNAPPSNLTAYTGPQGARGRDFIATNIAGTAQFKTTRTLYPAEGLTIVVEWPKGFVSAPTRLGNWKMLIRDNPGAMVAMGVALAAVLFYWLVWRHVGRDPRRGVIIPRYAPPTDFSPSAVRFLWRMECDNKCLTAAVVNLAVQGRIRIREDREGIFRKRLFTLIPLKNPAAITAPSEEIVRRELVGGGGWLELRQQNYEKLQSAQTELKKFLKASIEDKYFKSNWGWSALGFLLCAISLAALFTDARPETAAGTAFMLIGFFVTPIIAVVLRKKFHFGAGIILFCATLAAGFFLAGIAKQPAVQIFLPLALGTLAGLFHFWLKAYTVEGRAIMDEVEGFRRYLSVAEQDRLNLENPPERTPQLFEQFLPFALALGVEQKWAEQFAAILAAAGHAIGNTAYSPTWYSGNSWSASNPMDFSAAVGNSLAGAISSASTAPGSSSGGSGGGGGGGSSGGGGGGGGGGGW